MTKPSDMIKNFYPLLLDGDIKDINALFADEPFVNEPTRGEVKGKDKFEHFLRNYRQWMQHRNPTVEHVASTVTENRAVEEYILHLDYKGHSLNLPAAVAADMSVNKFTHVRIYHSLWPLMKRHIVRAPFLPESNTLTLPPLIKNYMEGLAIGDAEYITGLFEPHGYVREPSGEEFKHRELKGLRKFYRTALADGGIHLEHCSSTFDGVRCAVEFNINKWGKTELPPQAGIAVYEQSSRGRLTAARIYDDVAPPF